MMQVLNLQRLCMTSMQTLGILPEEVNAWVDVESSENGQEHYQI